MLMMSRQSTWLLSGAVSALTLVLAVFATAAPEGTLAAVAAGGSRIDFQPVGSFQCLQLTITGPDLAFEKSFDSPASPSFELPYPAADGAYRWQLSRADHACGARAGVESSSPSSTAQADDHNGRPGKNGGRPQRIASGPYEQSGSFRVSKGSIVMPSNVSEGGRKR
jgi:hypothetical protein